MVPSRRRRVPLVLLPVLLVGAAVSAVAGPRRADPAAAAPAGEGALAPPGSFELPLTAGQGILRVLDTRAGLGVPAGPVPAGGTVTLQVAGDGLVPAQYATAVVLNVTAIGDAPGYVQVYPEGIVAEGATSSLNVFWPGTPIANLVVVPLDARGRVSFHTEGGGHLVADVVGYFTVSPRCCATVGESSFPHNVVYEPGTPERIVDTRRELGVAVENPGDRVDCADLVWWEVANRYYWRYFDRYGDVAHLDDDGSQVPCQELPGAPQPPVPFRPPDLFRVEGDTFGFFTHVPGSGLEVLNVTVTDTSPGFFSLSNQRQARTSFLNATPTAPTVANTVVLDDPPYANAWYVYSESGGHVIADRMGRFVDRPTADPASSPGRFVPLTPTRLLDTRSGPRPGAGGTVTFRARGVAGIPADARAVVLTVTATGAAAPGFVQVLVDGVRPWETSNLNVTAAGQTVAATVFASFPGPSPDLSIFTQSGTHLVVDVTGYVVG